MTRCYSLPSCEQAEHPFFGLIGASVYKIRTHIHPRTHVHAYTHAHTHSHVRSHRHQHIRTHAHTHTHTRTHTHIHTHTRTHTHTQPPTSLWACYDTRWWQASYGLLMHASQLRPAVFYHPCPWSLSPAIPLTFTTSEAQVGELAWNKVTLFTSFTLCVIIKRKSGMQNNKHLADYILIHGQT